MDSRTAAGLDRLNGLLNWWGISGQTGSISPAPGLAGFAAAMAEMQKAYLDALERHLEIVFATHDRVSRSACSLATMRNPAAFVDAQAELMSTLAEASAAFARTWTELSTIVERVATSAGPVTKTRAPEASSVSETPSPSTQKAAA